jgi:hypothetical protein
MIVTEEMTNAAQRVLIRYALAEDLGIKATNVTDELVDERLAEIRQDDEESRVDEPDLPSIDDVFTVMLTAAHDADERAERDRIRLRDQGNDLLNIRGMLSPNGWPRRVPDDVEMVPNVAPAIRWLLDELERLTELVAARGTAGLPDWDDGTCGDCADGKCHGGDPDDCGCARHSASVTE